MSEAWLEEKGSREASIGYMANPRTNERPEGQMRMACEQSWSWFTWQIQNCRTGAASATIR